MSRARLLSTALGADGTLNISDVAGLGALAAKTTVSSADIDNASITHAKLSSTAITDKLGFTPLNPANNLSEISGASARANLGLHTAATSGSTSDLTEGTKLFYTDARARAAVSASGSLSYNSTTGVISYTTPSTSGITEGSNLYYTDARARAALSAGTGISYNSTTGAISNTITQYTDALARASLSAAAGSGAYNSTTGVITIPTNTSHLTNGAGYITGNQNISLSGDISGSGTTSIGATLATVNANVGSFGSSTQIPVVTVNAKGLVTGVSTAALAGGGKVKQMVTATSTTGYSQTGFSWASTDLSLTITPTASNSKILLGLSCVIGDSTGSNDAFNHLIAIYRNGTSVKVFGEGQRATHYAGWDYDYTLDGVFVDSPATTSAVTYTIYYRKAKGDGTLYFNSNSVGEANTSQLWAMEVAA